MLLYRLFFIWAALNIVGSLDMSFYETFRTLAGFTSNIVGIGLSIYVLYAAYCILAHSHSSNKPRKRG